MYKGHLPLLALLAILQPIALLAERNLVDGHQCCDRQSNYLVRDNQHSVYGKQTVSPSEDRRISYRDNRQTRNYEISSGDTALSTNSIDKSYPNYRNRVVNRIKKTPRYTDLLGVSNSDQQFRQRLTPISKDRERFIRNKRISSEGTIWDLRRERDFRSTVLNNDYDDSELFRSSRDDIRKGRNVEGRQFKTPVSTWRETKRLQYESVKHRDQNMENRNTLERERRDVPRKDMGEIRRTRKNSERRTTFNNRLEFILFTNDRRIPKSQHSFDDIYIIRDSSFNRNNVERRTLRLSTSSIERSDRIRNNVQASIEESGRSNSRLRDNRFVNQRLTTFYSRDNMRMESRPITRDTTKREGRDLGSDYRNYRSVPNRVEVNRVVTDRSDSKSDPQFNTERFSQSFSGNDNYRAPHDTKSRQLRSMIRNYINRFSRSDITRQEIDEILSTVNQETRANKRSITRATFVEQDNSPVSAQLFRQLTRTPVRDERAIGDRRNFMREREFRIYNREEKNAYFRGISVESRRNQNRENPSILDKTVERREINRKISQYTTPNSRREAFFIDRTLKTTSRVVERDVNDYKRNHDVIDFARNRDAISLNRKALSDTEGSATNWEYVLYTIQGIYLCGVLMQMMTGNTKKNRSFSWWMPSSQLIKVD